MGMQRHTTWHHQPRQGGGGALLLVPQGGAHHDNRRPLELRALRAAHFKLAAAVFNSQGGLKFKKPNIRPRDQAGKPCQAIQLLKV